MAKKSSSKKKAVKKTSKKSKKPIKVKNKKNSNKPTEVKYHSVKEIKVEKALIDNFVGLQKVMVNLSAKFDKLSDEMSKLLNLFEISAKAMAKKEFQSEKDPAIKKIHDKLDNLSKQAGLIGKGLALIHEANSDLEHDSEKTFEPHPSNLPKPSPNLLEAPFKKRHPVKMPAPGQKNPRPRNSPNQSKMEIGEGQTKDIGARDRMEPSIMPSEAEMAEKEIKKQNPPAQKNPQENTQIQNQENNLQNNNPSNQNQ